MFFFNPEKVSEFLNNIARGFERRPIDLVMFGVVILLIFGFLLTAYLLQRAKARRLAARLGRERYERLARKLGLTPAEEELVSRLVTGRAAAKDPGAKAQLLLSAASFNRAAGRLQERQPEQLAVQLAELRLKLGFQARNPERVPSASSELPAGLRRAGRAGGRGRVPPFRRPVQPRRPRPWYCGSRRRGACRRQDNRSRWFSRTARACFPSTPPFVSSGQGLLRVAQSEKLRRTQRRKYYRRKVQLAVQVRRFAGRRQPPQA